MEGGEGEGQAQEGSLMMHRAGRGATGGAVHRGVEGGPRCCRKAEGSGDPGASHRTNERESGACLQAEGGERGPWGCKGLQAVGHP